MPTTIARSLHDLFFLDCTHYAVGGVDGKGRVTYNPVEGVPSLAQIEQHLAGEIVLGAYTVLPGNKVRWTAFDVDSTSDPEKAKELVKEIHDYLEKIPHAVEWSGNKGYHLEIFFNSLYSAKEVKQTCEAIRDRLGMAASGDPHVEVFPKQGELNNVTPLGSLLRLPLGNHPKTKNKAKFVDPDSDWAELDPLPLLQQRVALKDLKELVEKDEDSGTVIDRLAKLLSRYWMDGQRHDLTLATAGYLGSLGWTEEGVQELIEVIYDKVGDGDLSDWQKAVRSTFAKIYAGENVTGHQGLAKILSADVLLKMGNLASSHVSTPTLKMIDGIRLGQGAAWQKVRTAAKSILSYFKENGKLVKDLNNAYWLNKESKELVVVNGNDWERLLHNSFGLNPIESFGKQTSVSVKLLAEDDAERVEVYKRFHFDKVEYKYYLNLGGKDVYVLNGNPEDRRLIANGDERILFLNNLSLFIVPNLLEIVEKVDPWDYTVNDLWFQTGSKVGATPTQQKELIKAFILSMLFSDIMPTRPILAFISDMGAGKTTAARRIMRLIEGPEEDVKGLNTDKPDSLRASLAVHRAMVLDNLEETKAHWLTDMLNRASTGGQIELRVLHTTNKMERFTPNCHILVTATKIPFSNETVFSRLLPVELMSPKKRKTEEIIQTEFVEHYAQIWAGMLDYIDMTISELKANRLVEAPTDSRLADFTVFCARIQEAACLNGKELMAGLQGMVHRQEKQAAKSSAFIPLLENLLQARPDEMAEWMSTAQLFIKVQRVATSTRADFPWSNAQGLSRHLDMLEGELKRDYQMESKKMKEGKMYRFMRLEEDKK